MLGLDPDRVRSIVEMGGRGGVGPRVRLVGALVIAVAMVTSTAGAARAASDDTKVVGGVRVMNEWPEVVYIEVDGVAACTGTLIKPRWVLTAAHCIGGSAIVYGGSNRLSELSWSIPTIAGYPHPQYSDASYGYDYGLYELAEPADVPIDVELADYKDTDLWDPGRQLFLMGFGLTDGLIPVDELLSAAMTVQADDYCVSAGLGAIFDPTTMICLYTPGVSGCSGDSGGPIFGLSGTRVRLVAVVSFGPEDCDSISVGAWVPGGLSWIESVTNGAEGSATYRLFGVDRYETAAAVASAWSTASLVYIATGENFPDSLAAGPAAAAGQAPILLVTHDSIPFVTAETLRRLNPSTIFVVGGTAAISDAVVAELHDYAAIVSRRAGRTRIGTAISLVQVAFPTSVGAARVWLAPSTSFQDPLLAAAAGAVHGEPLLLNPPGGGVEPAVWSEISRLGASEVVLVGDADFVSASLLADLATIVPSIEVTPGVDAYERGANLWSDFGAGTPVVILTTGENFPDALVGAAYSAVPPASPLLITRTTCVPDVVSAEIDRLEPDALLILGGPAAVSIDVEARLVC